MGHVRVTIMVANQIDQALVERGLMDAGDVRAVTLDDVMVDTGATLLTLPIDIIEGLGLAVRREVIVRTAAGHARASCQRSSARRRSSAFGASGCGGKYACTRSSGMTSASGRTYARIRKASNRAAA